jgi:hypothetical protein
MTENRINRRTVLRGLGTAMSLPLLEAMIPSAGLPSATLTSTARAAGGAAGNAAPKRLAWMFVPNGVHMPDWTPAAEGAKFDLPWILEPLKGVQKDLLVLTGLTHDKARANGDGGGDHARSAACFLTGCQPRKTDGANIRAGVSADQIAAGALGRHTRLPSLEIGCDRGLNSGNCDSGYSCAYSANISWKTESTPMAKEVNPRSVFERLFGTGGKTDPRRDRYRRSILDYVREDAGRLAGKLGAGDRGKLDEYLTAVREIEQRIERAEKDKDKPRPAAVKAPDFKGNGIPKEYGEHMRLLYDLLVLAFQSDTTRVATFMHANEGSNRPYPFIGVAEGHHDLSHHGGDKAKHEKIKKINRFHMEQFAYFVNRLKAIREGDGTLLDHCMLVYGSAISDGNRHNHDDLPIVVAGRGGGALATGRHLRFPKETPLNNLWLSLLDRVGAKVEALGDSTGRLANLS